MVELRSWACSMKSEPGDGDSRQRFDVLLESTTTNGASRSALS
jgi:hypothetical protein